MVLQAIRYVPAEESNAPSLDILDQLLLPHQSVYLPILNCEDAHDAIKTMKVRGAPAIAIVAALALAVELGSDVTRNKIPQAAEEVKDHIGRRLDYLKTSRPTAVNLADAVGKLKAVVEKKMVQSGASGLSVTEAYISVAERMLIDDVADNKAIGQHGMEWIESNTLAGNRKRDDHIHRLTILTHCNTGSLATAGYGTALGVIRSLHANQILSHAYCSETRPYNQGSRLTAYELIHDEIPATLITDSMAAALMAHEGEHLAAVIVGADRVAANGDTANKIGTYSLAVLARHHGVKFLVAAPRTTIDLATSSGRGIIIEQRASKELTTTKGLKVSPSGELLLQEEPLTISIAASGIDVWNPAFDVTPAELIDGVITECGVVEKIGGKFDFRPIFEQLSNNDG